MHLRLLNATDERLPNARANGAALARNSLLFELEQPGAARQAVAELVALLRGDTLSSFGFPDLVSAGRQAEDLTRVLEAELAAGRVELDFEPFAGTLRERDLLDIDLPSLGKVRQVLAPETSFIAGRLLDQKGAPVPGQRFQIELPDKTVRGGVTDADGFARATGFTQDGTAKITFPGFDELDFSTKGASDRLVFPVGSTPDEDADGSDEESSTADGKNAKALVGGAAAGTAGAGATRDAELPGQLFVQLFDKTGRERHAKRTFQITGPQPFEGTTDDQGRLQQRDVLPGNYSLSLALDFFFGDPDAVMDIHDLPLVVLDGAAQRPQVRLVGGIPRSVLAKLKLFFNTNKTFLLPTALPSVRKLRALYAKNAPCKLLVVGHADTRGDVAFNDKLSLLRAEATIAYLKDDVDAWLKFYKDSDEHKKWGKVEDHLMLTALPDYGDKPKGEDEVTFFQRTRNLKVDGDAGDETRRALVTEYMALDGASLSEQVGEIEAVAHGCGEHFPLDDTGEQLDTKPQNEKRDRVDRRVDLFFFDPEFGITPKPPGPNSKAKSPEYPLWRKRVAEVVELKAGDSDGPKITFVELTDAHFRTNSAVVLPEGEDPDDKGNHQAITSASLIGIALRFNQENPGHAILVAGHTDSVAEPDFNQQLSEERAQVALALLKGGDESREIFKDRCAARNRMSDINQILSWIARTLTAFKDPPFNCDPGVINDSPHDTAIRRFQTAFSAHRDALGSNTELKVDGSIGKEGFGAFFDIYEFALRQELGEDAAGLASLREKLVFADDQRQSLGFGERFPVEELGVDNFRSQTNRRVEILFIPEGEQPDLAKAKDNPEAADIYLPGRFQHTPLDVKQDDLIFGHLDIRLHVPFGSLPANSSYRLFASNVAFDSVLPSSAAVPRAKDFLALRFLQLNRKGIYTLEQIQGQARITVFQDLPFDTLIASASSGSSNFKIVPPRPLEEKGFLKYNLRSALDQTS